MAFKAFIATPPYNIAYKKISLQGLSPSKNQREVCPIKYQFRVPSWSTYTRFFPITLASTCLRWHVLGGTHKEPVPRERPDGEFPPGVNCYSKEPLSANPLLQVVLPQGFTHENRRSKGVSFKGSDLVFAKGTSRTRQQAEMACMSWAWSWWESLAPEKRSAILDSIQEPSAKKRKTS